MPHKHLNGSRIPKPIQFKSYTISDTAIDMSTIGFTADELSRANRAVFSVHGGEMHFRYDGNAPTGTVGLMLDDTGGDALAVIFGIDNVANLQFIKEAAGPDVTLSIQLESI